MAERITFRNSRGMDLAGLLDHPDGEYRGNALFAHCFTCSKEINAAAGISKRLAAHGWLTLRFDFTGLGESEGEFAETNFTTTVQDLVRAADHLQGIRSGPTLLLGHSWGGTAALMAASQISDARAVATVGAPYDPAHVRALLGSSVARAGDSDATEVKIAGRTFLITQQFLRDIESQPMQQRLARLGQPLLILHSPLDETVEIENAALLFENARHPRSFISLDGMDHLISDRTHREYVGDLIAAWAARYF